MVTEYEGKREWAEQYLNMSMIVSKYCTQIGTEGSTGSTGWSRSTYRMSSSGNASSSSSDSADPPLRRLLRQLLPLPLLLPLPCLPPAILTSSPLAAAGAVVFAVAVERSDRPEVAAARSSLSPSALLLLLLSLLNWRRASASASRCFASRRARSLVISSTSNSCISLSAFW